MITVLTPTYNRSKFLTRVYESLLAQTYQDFEWLVIDDGSSDDTQILVQKYIDDTAVKFAIRYYRQANGGKHTAVNYGVKKAKGELIFILDSDDKLLPKSLEIVASEYERIKHIPTIAGIAGLDCFADGRIIGSGLSREYIDCNAMDIRYKYNVQGDLKEVFRTSVLAEFPFPEIVGEHFCPEQLVWFRIAQKYKLHYFNQPVYVAEYQDNGLTAGITKARMNSPIASCLTYKEMLDYAIPLGQKIKAALNYWRFYACVKKSRCPKELKTMPFYWKIFAPFGQLLHLVDIKKIK